jgi:hypothetical protein
LGGVTFTGGTAGSVKVRATAADGSGVYDEKTITVNPATYPVTSLVISGGAASVNVDAQITFTATVNADATNKAINWSIVPGTGNATVVNGVVTGKAAGTVTVRAESVSNPLIFDEKPITVVGPPERPSAIIPSGNTVCTNTTGIIFSVTAVSGVTYEWTIPTGWSITSGNNTNSITVSIPANAVRGSVTVRACKDGLCSTAVNLTGSTNNPLAVKGSNNKCYVPSTESVAYGSSSAACPTGFTLLNPTSEAINAVISTAADNAWANPLTWEIPYRASGTNGYWHGTAAINWKTPAVGTIAQTTQLKRICVK